MLGDGTEVLSDSDDAEMFDEEETKDEEELEKKKAPSPKAKAEVKEETKSTEGTSNGTSEVVVPGQSSR